MLCVINKHGYLDLILEEGGLGETWLGGIGQELVCLRGDNPFIWASFGTLGMVKKRIDWNPQRMQHGSGSKAQG